MQNRAGRSVDVASAGQVAPPGADSAVTLSLLVAALEMQRRTSVALYHLLRSLSRVPGQTRRREARNRIWARQRMLRGGRRRVPEPMSSPVPSPGGEHPTLAGRLPPLQIRCFGRFEVLRDGVPIVQWRRGKAKLLLKFLVVRRQPVPRDVLIDLLWPEADPRAAVNGLRVTLHALRQALGSGAIDGQDAPDYVIYDGGSYGVNPAANLWVDADVFSDLFSTGIRLERQGQIAAAISHFEQAERLYRDDYLLEDLYEDWTLVRREELKDQYLMLLTKLADACLDRGDAEGCILRCHRILQKDPCREDAYQRLMRCYAILGQRSHARHWFEVCVRTLRRELDVAPSEETVQLHEAVCQGKSLESRTRGSGSLALAHRSAGGAVLTETRP